MEKRPIDAGFAFQVSDTSGLSAGACGLVIHSVREGGHTVARDTPEIRGSRCDGFRGGEQSSVVMTGDHQVAVVDKYPAFLGLQLDGSRAADIDSRAVMPVGCGVDHHWRSESGGGEADSRGNIGSRGVLGCCRMVRHHDFSRDEVGDSIAIGIGDHPARRERIGQVVGSRSGLIGDQRREYEQEGEH